MHPGHLAPTYHQSMTDLALTEVRIVAQFYPEHANGDHGKHEQDDVQLPGLVGHYPMQSELFFVQLEGFLVSQSRIPINLLVECKDPNIILNLKSSRLHFSAFVELDLIITFIATPRSTRRGSAKSQLRTKSTKDPIWITVMLFECGLCVCV